MPFQAIFPVDERVLFAKVASVKRKLLESTKNLSVVKLVAKVSKPEIYASSINSAVSGLFS